MTALFKPDTSGAQRTGPIFRQKQTGFDGVMRRRIWRYFTCFILIPGMIFFYPASESSAQRIPFINIKTDEVYAADFILRDLSGKNISLSDYKGKIILLNFMTTWCPECLASIPYLRAIYTRYHEKGLIIMNINIQETERKVTAYSKKHSLPYPTLLDQEGTISKSYGVLGVPVKVLIDRDGRIICWNCRSLDKLLESNLK